MKLGITSKLFSAILATSIIVALAMGAAVRYSFTQGFLGYLNEQETQRIESVLPNLEEAYREHGSWEFVRNQPRVWFMLLRPRRMPLPQNDAALPPPPPPESELTSLILRISLLDQQKQLVIGNPQFGPEATLKPIYVDGNMVGWLALVPFKQVSTAAELRFQEQQVKSRWIIGALSIMLAAIVAWLLAKMFLAPLKRIAASTRRLAAGDYETRVPVLSSDELGLLAQDFNHLALALKKNEGLRRDFMADISHELRTPLSVLKGELEAVEDGIRPMTLTTIQSLQAEVATLGKLVNDLYELSLSDVGALTYRKQRVDVLDILRLTAAAFQERFAEKGIHPNLVCDAGKTAFCNADPNRLQQLFNNVLENSVRYTDPNGRLEIACSLGANTVTIDFQDSAPGVPGDMLAHLFDRFYRVENSRNRATGGAGLGLAISRNIAEAHQGAMTAQASPLGGIWISVTLPLAGKEPA
jgi:two-component system sensor histidine kinase BaeS